MEEGSRFWEDLLAERWWRWWLRLRFPFPILPVAHAPIGCCISDLTRTGQHNDDDDEDAAAASRIVHRLLPQMMLPERLVGWFGGQTADSNETLFKRSR